MIAETADALRKGQLAAIPTETVYGLAADATCATAVANIFAAKGRPADNPLICHVSSVEMARAITMEWPEAAQKLADAFWPGPLTIILPKKDIIPDIVTCGSPTVAVRFPSHPTARALIEAVGRPLAAPSANRSGSPSPTTAAHCVQDLDGRVEYILDAGCCDIGVESTVLTLCTETPRLLRPGFVTLDELRDVLGEVDLDPAVFAALKDGQPVSSPGMKYRHYAPKGTLCLLEGELDQAAAYVRQHPELDTVLCFDGEESRFPVRCIPYGAPDDTAAQAAALFDALRQLDTIGSQNACARCPTREGVGMAIWNRLLRAARLPIWWCR